MKGQELIRIFKDEKGNIVDTYFTHHAHKLSKDMNNPSKFTIEWINLENGKNMKVPIHVYYSNYRVYNALTGFWVAENSWKKGSIVKLLTNEVNEEKNSLKIKNALS